MEGGRRVEDDEQRGKKGLEGMLTLQHGFVAGVYQLDLNTIQVSLSLSLTHTLSLSFYLSVFFSLSLFRSLSFVARFFQFDLNAIEMM